jgi:peptidoglycan-N-acetylglucosamine deacetylase
LRATVNDRWSWDFEEERRPLARSLRAGPAAPGEQVAQGAPPGDRGAPPSPARAGDAAATTAHGSDGERRAAGVRRRRRALALVAAIGALALAVALIGGHGGRSHGAAGGPGATRGRVGGASVHAPDTPEDDHDAAVSSVLAYTPFVKEGAGRGRDIALTFDDGPGPYTPGVLGVLERLRVHATFFVIGKMLRYFSASAVREIHDGDVIGDHTETHPQMALLSAHEQYEQLFEQIARVELLGGSRPVLFRPPYGSFNATTMRELHRLHLLMTLWSVDTGDYLQPGVPAIVQRVLAGAHPGAIILMHDAGGTRTQTIEALPTIIDDLRARGYRLVTVPQLLHDDPPPAGQPLPPNLSGD